MATNLEILAEFGFVEIETGGGCTALAKSLSDNTIVLVTDYDDECTAPTEATVKFCVGHYTEEHWDELSMAVGDFAEISSRIQTILLEAEDKSK